MLKDEGIEIFRFWVKFFVSSSSSRYLRKMKTVVLMMKTSGHQGTLQFVWNGELSLLDILVFSEWIYSLVNFAWYEQWFPDPTGSQLNSKIYIFSALTFYYKSSKNLWKNAQIIYTIYFRLMEHCCMQYMNKKWQRIYRVSQFKLN